MRFPDQKEIERALKKLQKSEGTLLISKDASPLEKFRWDLCQRFVAYKMANDLTQKELAQRLGVDEGKVSKILRHRIESFSTDRLIKLFSILEPNLSLNVG